MGELTVTGRSDDGYDVLVLDGELDARAQLDLRLVPREQGFGQPLLVLDVSAVSFVDSLGVATLLAVARDARERGATAVLVGCQPAVLRLVELVQLGDVVPVYATWDALREREDA